MDGQPGRKSHLHDPPLWVDPARSDYFITICCRLRGANQLCQPATSSALLDSARFYQQQKRWFLAVFLLMPDHLHMIVNFGYDQDMTSVIKAWKSYHAKRTGIRWQDGFFEHRLRGERAWTKRPLTFCRIRCVRAWYRKKPRGHTYSSLREGDNAHVAEDPDSTRQRVRLGGAGRSSLPDL